jgi:beta-lactamase superfamily II metal-dependent hydrolase
MRLRYDGGVRAFLPVLLLLGGSAYAASALNIYFIDVEGGQSTLVVSPSGQSLLIDAGYAGFGGRDALRIKTAAKAAGVGRIDYLLVTHFHSDHVGGVPNLLEVLPVENTMDYGGSVDAGGKYPDDYAAAVAKIEKAKGTHRVVVPGDKIPVKGLDVTVVTAAGKAIQRPLNGGGQANPYCSGVGPHPEGSGDETGENPQAVGVVIELGKFRFGDFSDITWNKELALLCPENKVGKLDLYLTTHHGAESSKAIYGLAPRVAIMNNGPTKGGDPMGWKVVKASPGLEDLWQLHFAIAGGSATNVADSFIANVDNDLGEYLKVTAESSGTFTVVNHRNKYSRTYPAK